jgi:hypothetical protein
MAELIFLLVLAGVLLVAVPQILGYLGANLALRWMTWSAFLVAIAIPPAVFYLVATHLYSPESSNALQETIFEKGQIVVTNVRFGAMAHAGVAAVVQIVRVFRGV